MRPWYKVLNIRVEEMRVFMADRDREHNHRAGAPSPVEELDHTPFVSESNLCAVCEVPPRVA